MLAVWDSAVVLIAVAACVVSCCLAGSVVGSHLWQPGAVSCCLGVVSVTLIVREQMPPEESGNVLTWAGARPCYHSPSEKYRQRCYCVNAAAGVNGKGANAQYHTALN